MGIIEYLNKYATNCNKDFIINKISVNYKLEHKEAKEIYEKWRHQYVTDINLKKCKASKGKSIRSLSEKIKSYSERNFISEKDIYRYIELRKKGIFDSKKLCEEIGLTKEEQFRLYVFLKQYDVLNRIEKRQYRGNW